jgi:hypothetical protein
LRGEQGGATCRPDRAHLNDADLSDLPSEPIRGRSQRIISKMSERLVFVAVV